MSGNGLNPSGGSGGLGLRAPCRPGELGGGGGSGSGSGGDGGDGGSTDDAAQRLFGSAQGHPGRVSSLQRSAAAAQSRAFNEACAALDDVHATSMTTAAFRMALMRALSLFQAAAAAGIRDERLPRIHASIEMLENNLEIDWRHVIEAELRYRDDTTEFINVKIDPDASRKFQEATQFRVITTA